MTEPPTEPPIVLPKSFRVMEAASVVLCAGLLLVLSVRVGLGLARGPLDSSEAIAIVGSVLVGYLAADFASGLVHFLADTFGSIETPLLGRKFILPFRSHHERPHEITEHDFIETNGDSCFIALVVLVPVLFTVPVTRGGGAAFAGLAVLVMLTLVVFTNQFHKWAHADDAPRFVRALQRAGLVLRPSEHAKHHQPPFVGRYCITSGVLNAPLDALGVFPAIERLVRAISPSRRSRGAT